MGEFRSILIAALRAGGTSEEVIDRLLVGPLARRERDGPGGGDGDVEMSEGGPVFEELAGSESRGGADSSTHSMVGVRTTGGGGGLAALLARMPSHAGGAASSADASAGSSGESAGPARQLAQAQQPSSTADVGGTELATGQLWDYLAPRTDSGEEAMPALPPESPPGTLPDSMQQHGEQHGAAGLAGRQASHGTAGTALPL